MLAYHRKTVDANRPNSPQRTVVACLQAGTAISDDNSLLKFCNMPSPKQRKVAIVGSRSVGMWLLLYLAARFIRTNSYTGKSSLAVQYVDGHFVDSYYPTIENTFSKTIRYKGQDFATEIVDTAGQVRQGILSGCDMVAHQNRRMNTVFSTQNTSSAFMDTC